MIVVIPNHLPTLDFLKEWEELKLCKIIVVQDIGDKPSIPDGFDVTIYDHKDIKKDLGKNDWIIPSRTSACRSYGYYKAWQQGDEFIGTLDNDCFPETEDYWIDGHLDNLVKKVTLGWASSVPDNDIPTRGFPYLIRNKSPIMLSHGLWSNVPDFDGIDMLKQPERRFKQCSESKLIPKNNYYPMCGMNLAWKRDITPLMYFGIFGPEYGHDQLDDITAGILSKKVLDHLNYGVISGYPSVEHRKQSNAFVNLTKQAPSLYFNEIFWKEVDKIQLTKYTPVSCYKELINKLPKEIDGDINGWWSKYLKACKLWINLY